MSFLGSLSGFPDGARCKNDEVVSSRNIEWRGLTYWYKTQVLQLLLDFSSIQSIASSSLKGHCSWTCSSGSVETMSTDNLWNKTRIHWLRRLGRVMILAEAFSCVVVDFFSWWAFLFGLLLVVIRTMVTRSLDRDRQGARWSCFLNIYYYKGRWMLS